MKDAFSQTRDRTYNCIIPMNSMPFVAEAGSGKVIKPYRHMDRQADFNVMIYITKGSMEIVEEGKTWRIGKGDLFFLKKGLHHWGEKPFEIGTSWCYAHFYTQDKTDDMYSSLDHKPITGMPLVIKEEDFHAYLPIPKLSQVREGSSLESAVFNLCQIQSSAKVLERNLLMWKILKKILDQANRDQESGKEARWLDELVTYIEDHYNEALNMERIQKRFGLSYKYIGKCFKDKTGLTIKAYQKKLRLEKAALLLGQSHLSIGEIADETGYGDLFYFSRLFKEVFCVSPTHYRQHYRPRL